MVLRRPFDKLGILDWDEPFFLKKKERKENKRKNNAPVLQQLQTRQRRLL